MLSRPGVLLRVEGAVLFLTVLYFYHVMGSSWGLFLLLFLWPDLGMLGYLANPKMGANLYNLAHFSGLPAVFLVVSYVQHRPGLISFALIWLAHIEFDRALGYGLKFPTFFKDTHLQRV